MNESGVTGGLADQMRAALDQSSRSPWVLLGLGLLGILVSGRALGIVMVAASCTAWRVPIEGKVPWRIIGSVVGLVGGMGLIALIVNKVRAELGLGVAGLSLGAALLVYALAWLSISWMLPRGTDDPGALLPGAVFVGCVIVLMHAVSQWYLPGRFERANQLFGAIGAAVVTLGWFFLLGRALVLSMELNSVVYERHGSLSRVVFSLPVLRALPRRSERVRRFFDLEPPPG